MSVRYLVCAWRMALLFAVLAFAGCSVAREADEARSESETGGTTSVPSSEAGVESSITFDQSTISLPVLGRTKLSARVSPIRNQRVAFALIGSSADASLEAAEVTSDDR